MIPILLLEISIQKLIGRQALEGVDTIFHLAGRAHIKK